MDGAARRSIPRCVGLVALGAAYAIVGSVAVVPVVASAAPQDYYDSDGDGTADEMEYLLGTNPYDPSDRIDSDGDGVGDADETALGLDPNVSFVDSDNDWLPDSQEAAWGTYPMTMDSDGDSVWDGVEVACNTDPTDPYWYDYACANAALDSFVANMQGIQPIIDTSLDPGVFCNPYDPYQVC